MLQPAHERREPALVDATLCGRAAQQTNSSYSQWRKVPRGNAHDSGADRFSPCRLHAAIYEPIVYYLRIAGGIVKRATTIGRASRLGCWKIIHPCTVRRIRR